MDLDALRRCIRDIPDFPVEGVTFRDITPLLADPAALAASVDLLSEPFLGSVDVVAGVEARGFIFAAPVAHRLGAGFIPIRKPGKLPWSTVSAAYELEYGIDTLEIHEDAVGPGDRVLLVDDVLATGGTAAAAASLIEGAGATLVGCSFLIELDGLGGRSHLGERSVHALVHC